MLFIIMSALGVSFEFLAERTPSSAMDHTRLISSDRFCLSPFVLSSTVLNTTLPEFRGISSVCSSNSKIICLVSEKRLAMVEA